GGPVRGGRVAAEHDGELPALHHRHAAGDGGVQQGAAGRGDQRLHRPDRRRRDGAHLQHHGPVPDAGREPGSAPVDRLHGGVVSQRDQDHVGAAGRLRGGVDHPRAGLGGDLCGPLAGPVVEAHLVPGTGQTGGHGGPHPAGADERDRHYFHPPSTTRSTPLTDGFSSRNRTASTMSAMVARRPVSVPARNASSTSAGFSAQNGLSPTMPGCRELTRIGASSTDRVRTMPITPPLTVETIVEPGYGRTRACPPKMTIDELSDRRDRSALTTAR